jgi:outer membrane protein TolC
MTMTRKRTWAGLAALAAALAARPAAAQPGPARPARGNEAAAELERAYAREIGVAGGLTAGKAAARAAAHSPAAAASGEEVAAAESQLAGTRLEFLPRTGLTGRYTRISPTGDASIELGGLPPVTIPGPIEDQWWFGAQVQVPLSDYVLRLGRAVAARRHSLRAAGWMREAERRRAAAEARLAYYDWARASLGLLVAERARAQAAQHRALAERRLAAASLTRADLLLTESRLAEADELVTRARLAAELAGRRLRVAMGAPPAERLSIGEDVLAALPAGPAADDEELVAGALAARPELRALGESAGAVSAQRDLEGARFLPRLDIVGNLARANPNPRAFPQSDEFDTIWDVSAVLSWALDDVPRAREKRRELSARRRQLDDQRRQLRDGVVLEVTRAAQEVRAAQASIETSRRALAAAEEGHRVRERLFEVGSASSTELGDAETDLTRARFGVLDAHIALRKARVALDLAAGR